LEAEARISGAMRYDAMLNLRNKGSETFVSRRTRAGRMSFLSENTILVTEQMRRCKAKMLQQKQTELSQLWWTGCGVSIFKSFSDGKVDYAESWNREEYANRSTRQYGALRTRELTVDKTSIELLQQERGSFNCWYARIQDSIPRSEVLGQHDTWIHTKRDDIRADCQSIQHSEKLQTKRRVWDVLNAGPRNRFVVGGLIVSNCIVIDHANSIRRHGFFEDDIAWTLEWGERPAKTHEPRATITCPSCGAIYRGGKCRACGYEPTGKDRKAQGLTFAGGELNEIKKSSKKESKQLSNEEIMRSALFKAGHIGGTWGQAWAIAKKMAEQQGTHFKVPATVEVAGHRYKMIPFGNPDSKRQVRHTYGFTVGKYGREDNPYRIS